MRLFLIACLALSTFNPILARASSEGDDKAVRACLAHWGKHPFSKTAVPPYRTVSAKVKVLGIGKDLADEERTTAPVLVLVKANVNVLSSTRIALMNPNGWYCLKGQVTVLGKAVVNLHCKASLASSEDGVTVLGGADSEGPVTVLGSSRLNRVGCETPSAAPSAVPSG